MRRQRSAQAARCITHVIKVHKSQNHADHVHQGVVRVEQWGLSGFRHG